MKDLVIEATKITPEIIFKPSEEYFSIKGSSLPEDSREFYCILFDWVNEFKESDPRDMKLQVQLEYFNSSSSKQILKLFYLLEDLDEVGFKVDIVWLYRNEDHLIREKGEEFKDMIDIPLEIQSI